MKKKKHDLPHYISYVDSKSPYYLVRVPKIEDDGRRTFWRQEIFTVSVYGPKRAKYLALRYRQKCLESNKVMPSSLALSKEVSEIDENRKRTLREMSSLQLKYGFFRLPTLALLGMFEYQSLCTQDLAEHLDIEDDDIRSQISGLKRRGFLELSEKKQVIPGTKKRSFFSLTSKGKQMILDFRNSLATSHESVRLHPFEHYRNLYVLLRKESDNYPLSVVEIAILLSIDVGVVNPSKISLLLDRRSPNVISSIKRAAQKNLIEMDSEKMTLRKAVNMPFSSPVYKVSNSGRRLIELASSI